MEMMREKKVGLAVFGDQGMEAANQSRKKSAKRTRSMNHVKGLMSDCKRLCQDKHIVTRSLLNFEKNHTG